MRQEAEIDAIHPIEYRSAMGPVAIRSRLAERMVLMQAVFQRPHECRLEFDYPVAGGQRPRLQRPDLAHDSPGLLVSHVEGERLNPLHSHRLVVPHSRFELPLQDGVDRRSGKLPVGSPLHASLDDITLFINDYDHAG